MKKCLLLLLLVSCVPVPLATSTNGLRCVEGNVTVFIKGSLMRVEASDAFALYTDEFLYSWQGEKGTVMNVLELEKMAAGKEFTSPRETVEEIKQGGNCVPVSVSDEMFLPPDGVEFADLTEMVNKLEQMMVEIEQ